MTLVNDVVYFKDFFNFLHIANKTLLEHFCQVAVFSKNSFHVFLIAVPILLQVYLNASLTYGLMRWLRVPCVPAGRSRKDSTSCSLICTASRAAPSSCGGV